MTDTQENHPDWRPCPNRTSKTTLDTALLVSSTPMWTATTRPTGLSLPWPRMLNLTSRSVIEYTDMREAEEAMSKLSGIDLNGVAVKLEFAPVSLSLLFPTHR